MMTWQVDVTNKGGVTPLIYAASEGWDDCVPLLLKAGANRALATAKGRTALQAAKEKVASLSSPPPCATLLPSSPPHVHVHVPRGSWLK